MVHADEAYKHSIIEKVLTSDYSRLKKTEPYTIKEFEHIVSVTGDLMFMKNAKNIKSRVVPLL